MENKFFIKYINSPIGWLEIKTSSCYLLSISFKKQNGVSSTKLPEVLLNTENQLNDYFGGKRKMFNLKTDPKGTVFQKQVWNIVESIGFGKTASYLDIAKQSGSKKNTRAVGMANGKNPIPIIIPCHRIIGSNGKLTGYAGGLEKKRWLLQHEIQFSEKSKLLF